MHSHGWGWNKRQAETGNEMRKGAAESLHFSQMDKQTLGDYLLPLRCVCGCSLAGWCSAAAPLTDGGRQSLFFVIRGFSACNWSTGPHTAETLRTP